MIIIRGLTIYQWRCIQLRLKYLELARRRDREEDITQDFVVEKGSHGSEEDRGVHD